MIDRKFLIIISIATVIFFAFRLVVFVIEQDVICALLTVVFLVWSTHNISRLIKSTQ